MNTFETIQKIIAEKISVRQETITMESKIEDFESWDSMQHLAIIMDVESQLNCSIPFDQVVSLKSVKDLVDSVELNKS